MNELDEETARADQRAYSVSALRVDVVEGPDAGTSAVAKDDRLTIGTAAGNDLVLTDPTVSRYHLELARSDAGIVVVDHGSTNGTWLASVRIAHAWVGPGAMLELGHSKVRVADGQPVSVDVHEGERLAGLSGRSLVMRRLMAKIASVARSEASVLVVGETGTGKELVARALHDVGPRASAPFVIVDCGAVAPNLIASQLFGHIKGAFTGADADRRGAFALANGGTLFLDEIGELPSELQPTLLGALERRRFRPIGSEKEIGTDVRVVAATNRDLREEVNAGSFRPDLYYRLAVVTLFTPPLRERAEDVPLLLEQLLAEAGHDGPLSAAFTEAQVETLRRHRWPGNVRELRNLVEATLATGEVPDVGSASRTAAVPGVDSPTTASYKDARSRVLHDFERGYLAALLERAGGNASEAARLARMNRSYLLELLRKHDLR
jgi:DNA-binding NtrC family response regulator